MSVYLWNIELIRHHPAALDGTVGNGQNLAVFHALKAGIWRLLTLPPAPMRPTLIGYSAIPPVVQFSSAAVVDVQRKRPKNLSTISEIG